MMCTAKATIRRWTGPTTATGDRRGGGFTLLELMIVISVVAILATLAFPTYQRYVIRAKETSLKNSLFVFRDVIDQYYADHGRYPAGLDNLVEEKYLRAIPRDPFTRSRETWILIPAEEGGIFDVHSGSDLVGMDGTPYNEW